MPLFIITEVKSSILASFSLFGANLASSNSRRLLIYFVILPNGLAKGADISLLLEPKSSFDPTIRRARI